MGVSKRQWQVVMLYGATVAGVVLGFVASIINTDTLNVDDYGSVRYVQNIIQFIASLLLFGYFLSGSRLLALSQEETRSRRIRGAMIIVLAACSLLLIAGILAAAYMHKSLNVLSAHKEMYALFLVSVPVCFYPLFLNYINTTAQGDNHIFRLSMARLLPALIYVLLANCIYGLWGASPSHIIIAQWGIYSIVLLIIILSTKVSFKGQKTIFEELNQENRNYGFLLYLGSLAMVATNYIAGITLGLFNDDKSNVGFYTLALNLTNPLAYLPGIIGTTYFRRFSTQRMIPASVMRNTILLTVLSCVCFIIAIRPVVSFLYKPEYDKVGIYASWMSVGFCIHGIGDMLNRFLGSHGQGKPILVSSIACGVVKVSGFIFLVWIWNIEGALITNVASSTIYFVVLLFYYKKHIGDVSLPLA